MATFTDKQGTDWLVEIDTGVLKEIKQNLGVELLDLDGTFFAKILVNDVLLVDVLYFVCRQQAEQRNIDDVDFGRRLARGEVIEQATEALIGAMTDFFPPRRRAILEAAIKKHRELEEKMLARSMAMFQSGQIEEMAERKFAEVEAAFRQATCGS